MGTSRAGISDTQDTVRRACDRCHSRKVKCDGQYPCARCTRKKEACAFNKPVLPKGPTPRRSAPVHSSYTDHRYQARQSTSASPILSEERHNFVEVGGDRPDEVQPIWDPSILEEFTDWTTFLNSRPPSRTPTRPHSRANSRPNSRHTSKEPSAVGRDTSTWLMVRSRPATPPALSIPNVPQYEFAPPLSQPSLGLTVPLFNVPFIPPEDISPILTLTLETVIKPQLDVFFVRIFPMMPVFPPSYTFSRLSDPNSLRCPDFVAMILSMSALSLIHPLMSHEMVEKVARAKKAKVLLDEAGRLMSRWDLGLNVTLEAVMAKYLMFGTLFELGHTGPAKLRLKEAVNLGAEMYLDRVESYSGLEPAELKRRMRMYWVLAVTERAYALQRSGGVIFNGSIKRIANIELDPPSISLHYLTQIFSYLDQDIITCWNNQCPRAYGQTCYHLTRDRVLNILSSLNGSAPEVFGDGSESDFKQLTDSQRADLFITWQWVKNRIWRLAALHGLTTEEGPSELGVGYVVSAAVTTVAICRRLPLSAMESHGTGFLEKLYDIGSILTNLLSSPSMALQATLVATIQSTSWSETLESLYSFLSLHRGGTNDFASQLGQAIKIAGSMRLLTGVPTYTT